MEQRNSQSLGRLGTAALAWLLLIVAIFGPTAADARGWDSAIWGWLVAPLAGLVLLLAARLWMMRGDAAKSDRILEIVSWLFPVVDRFKKAVEENFDRVRENAQLVTNLRSVMSAYRLTDIDEDTADAIASARGEDSDKVRSLNPRTAAALVAEEVNKQVDWGEGLALCLETIYADNFGTTPPSGAVDRELLARIVAAHPLVSSGDPDHDIRQVRTALSERRYRLDDVLDALHTRQQGVVDDMADVLKTYDLGELVPADRADIAVALTGNIPDLPKRCASAVHQRIDLDVSASMLELFYRDRYRLSTDRLWNEFRSDPTEVARQLLRADFGFARRPGGVDEPALVIVLKAMHTFDTSLITSVDLRLRELSTLAKHYAEFLREQGIAAHVPSGAILDAVKNRLPASAADLWRLRDPAVDLDVLCSLGRGWMEEIAGISNGDDAKALSVVAAGTYLAHFGRRDALLPNLARRAGRSDDDDRAAEVLLAQLWFERSLVPGVDRRWPNTTVGELAEYYEQWFDGATAELGDTARDVVSAITEELIHSNWPTKLPTDRAMVELLERQVRLAEAIEQLQDSTLTGDELEAFVARLEASMGLPKAQADTSSIAGATSKLEAAYRKIEDEVGQLRERWSEDLSKMMVALVDELQTNKPVGALGARNGEPGSGHETLSTQRRLVEEAKVAAIQATATPLERLSHDVTALAEADRDLAARVDGLVEAEDMVSVELEELVEADLDLAARVESLADAEDDMALHLIDLTEAERELAEAVRDIEKLLAGDIARSKHYLLTFDSKTGPLARLIDALATDFGYDFKHYTAYARYGKMPEGQTFDEFHEQLTADLSEVILHRKTLVPDYEWAEGDDWAEGHDLTLAEVTVQLIAKPLRKNVRTGAQWWRTDGSTVAIS